MRAVQAVPFVFLGLGAAVVAWAVRSGQASTGVLLIFPYVAGSSGLLALGVVLLIVGVFTVGLAIDPEPTSRANVLPRASQSSTAVQSSTSSGGLVLLGPIPIFFGSWGHPQRWVYWLALAVGVIALALLFLGGLWVSR